VKTALVFMVALALLGACGDDTTASNDTTTTSSTESAAVDPELLTIHPVLQEAPPPCGALTAGTDEVVVADPSDGAPSSCLRLGPAAIDATAIENAEIVATGSADRFDVAVQLDADGSRVLDELAQERLGERLALLVRGRLVSAPTIQATEFAGAVGVSNLTRDEAVDLVAAVGGDATAPPPNPDAAQAERASAVCESFLSSAGEGASLGVSIPDTAGSITALLGDEAVEPWKSLPEDHFVARCSYLLPSVEEPSTTICADGDAVSLEEPVQFLVDEGGQSTQDPTADIGAFPPCP
jgi:hypothetical protein